MTPEIARRCISCGASVRVRAAFCPHCGNRLGEAGSGAGAPVDKSEAGGRDKSDRRPTTDAAPQGSQSGRANPSDSGARRSGSPSSSDAASDGLAGEVRTRGRAITGRLAGVGARVKQHPVTVAARDAVGENLRPRVEKIRQASNVVLDEAADDPSLRFLLIAALLFLVFLLILLFSSLLR